MNMFFYDLYKDFRLFFLQKNIFLSFAYVLVIAFPLFMLSVRDWSSGIYSLLCLISIGFLFDKNDFEYSKEIKVYLWIVLLFFVSILISSTLNGWTENSISRLGTETKIIASIPLFLLFAQYVMIRKWYFTSIPIAGIILGVHGILDVLVFNAPYADSAYGKIITGDISALLVGLSGVLLIYTKNKLFKSLLIFSMVLAAIACILSTSRNGWLALAVNLLFLIFLTYKKNRKIALLLFLLPLTSLIFSSQFISPERYLDRSVYEFKDFFKNENKKIDIAQSSVGTRLEQWRVALIAFRNQPIFGGGPGNSALIINKYVEKGEADKALYQSDAHTNMGHVHNQFFEVLLTQGLFGLVLIMLMYIYPGWVFIKNFKRNEIYASLGLVLVVSYIIFSLTEIPFISDNFTSIYFMYLSILFLNTIEKIPLPEKI